ncbi:hypothetical protein E1A91_D06G201900v1 [Gossypium mustelinum]|uniref:Uncharacterized protein n=1 Tax=Gossypium mustelinum TaxID=34275 RepID=A0A5D2UNH5_GOSMU|nr:hypothetical protein E1A91_D06G201900v1 [Gossypium mustelinum]
MGVIIQFLFNYVTLPLYAFVTQFTEEAGQFNGLDVLGDGNAAVIKYLDEKLSIIMEESYEHKYLYDWRTKKPTIFRATEQWFASMEGFYQAAMDAIGHVKWIPAKMEEFTEKERELRTSSLTRKQPNTGSKETNLDEVLCRHKERKPFAYGLCNECYEEFMKVSGGLDEGSDPPAFQRAEKERLAKLSIQENAKLYSLCEKTIVSISAGKY